jgi:hypothetical protein
MPATLAVLEAAKFFWLMPETRFYFSNQPNPGALP